MANINPPQNPAVNKQTIVTPTGKVGKIAISLSSTEIKGPKRHWKTKEALAFRKLVESAGLIEANRIREMVSSDYLPESFTSEQLTAALHLYSLGVSSEKLEEKINDSLVNLPALSETEEKSLRALPYLINTFEDFDPKQTIATQSRYVPEIEIGFSDAPPTENQFVLTSDGNAFRPIMEGALGEVEENVIGAAKDKITNFATRAIKRGGKKIKKEAKRAGRAITKKLSGLFKKGAKAGVKVAKTGADIAIASTGVGALAVIGKKALGWMAKHLIPKNLRDWIDRNKGKILVGVIGVIFAMFAKMIFDVLITILKVLAGFTLFVILFTALTLLIINNSAYLTSPAPPLTPGSPFTESAYFEVIKTANPPGPFRNNELPQTITYTITVTVRQGTIGNITFQSNCSVVGGSVSFCPPEENITVNYPDLGFGPCNGEGHRCYPSNWTGCIDPIVDPDPDCSSSSDQCASTCDAPPGPTPTSAPVIIFPPPAPGIITPSLPYVITYTQTFDSNYEDSMIIDTFTVTADAPTATGEAASGRAEVIFGTLPPSSCPIMGGRISCGCYDGDESPPRCTHGSNAYWSGLGTPCRYDIPIGVGCSGPTVNTDTGGGIYPADNDCRNNPPLCDTYGYATDSPSSPGTPVYLPTIYNRSIDWSFSHQSPNHGGSWGYSLTYLGRDEENNSYQTFLTHLNNEANPVGQNGTVPSGTQMGTLFGRPGFGSHIHIELQINGQSVCPDFLCE
jgi:hypothetical protein